MVNQQIASLKTTSEYLKNQKVLSDWKTVQKQVVDGNLDSVKRFIGEWKEIGKLEQLKEKVTSPDLPQREYAPEFEYTLIHICAKCNRPEILQELLACGVAFNVNQKDAYGRTPLAEACVQGNEEIVRILLQAGANVNIHNKYQNTPLIAAAYNNHQNIVTMLLEHKADIMKQNYEQKTCLKMAEDMQHVQLVDVLDFHMKKEIMWRNRNCLLKIALSREVPAPNNLFKGFSLDMMREIMKYA
ncbi:hypothetical protein FGO68_gene16551 [Halteria grandinella]|uniref:Ankyrin repeat domain-containing protein n=1 Tax=Halteria grandinella TaxID=5974 RepID=A0A8J8NPM4_HALGN|nr:hypothetical protein FGO68_gene16551 [Halteria grandinella]